tara:strand:- start:20 stop:622 length:603 start_codon:yes stop_codon:yes gene_type:complete
MDLLEIERIKKISIICKEMLILLNNDFDINFIKKIYDKNEIIINDFNKKNITTINPTLKEIGKFNSAVKSYARTYFKEILTKKYPDCPELCNKCLLENNIIESREKITGVIEDSFFCDNCKEEDYKYCKEFDEVHLNYDLKLNEIYSKVERLKIDKYWINAYILLSRKYYDIKFIDDLGKATKEIIKTEILKQISTIKIN